MVYWTAPTGFKRGKFLTLNVLASDKLASLDELALIYGLVSYGIKILLH